MLPGLVPIIATTTVSSGYSFTLTAGQNGNLRGYRANGTGSVNPNPPLPIPPFPSNYYLEFFQYNTSSTSTNLSFGQNIISLLTGLSVYVNGVSYGSNWKLFTIFGDTFTQIDWSAGTGPVFVNGVTYSVEIK